MGIYVNFSVFRVESYNISNTSSAIKSQFPDILYDVFHASVTTSQTLYRDTTRKANTTDGESEFVCLALLLQSSWAARGPARSADGTLKRKQCPQQNAATRNRIRRKFVMFV